ncbi:45972_t:CDS:2, partial [Gigaspora margarita]
MGKENKEKISKKVSIFKNIYTPETISLYFELKRRYQENNNKCKQEINQPEMSNPSRRQTFPIASNSKMNGPIPKPPIHSSSVANAFSSSSKVSQQSESRTQTVNGFKEEDFIQALVQNYDNTTFYTNDEPIILSVSPIQVNATNSLNSNHSISNFHPYASAAYELVKSHDDPLIRHNKFFDENVIINGQIFNNYQTAGMSQVYDNYYSM